MAAEIRVDTAGAVRANDQGLNSDSDLELQDHTDLKNNGTVCDHKVSNALTEVNGITRGDAEQVVGFSMSRAQTQMKSPQTPASEKARLLQSADTCVAGAGLATDGPTLDYKTHDAQQEYESGMSGSIHLEATEASSTTDHSTSLATTKYPYLSRKRSSSVPAVFAENIRRLLPEMSSILLPRSTYSPSISPSGKERDLPGKKSGDELHPRQVAGYQFSPLGSEVSASNERCQSDSDFGLNTTRGSRTALEPSMREELKWSPNGDASSLFSPGSDSRPGPLRRMASDNSLFLRRSFSGASSFDDTARFGDMSEQVNSRFKAITDTFQDTNFKLPKMPSINFAALRPGPAESSHSDSICPNTLFDANRTKPDASYLRPSARGKRAGDGAAANNQSTHPVITASLSKMTGDVVVLGGYRGSILRSAKPPHRQIWIPVKVGLNLRKVDLEVGLTDEDEHKMHKTVIASGSLSHIGPIDLCRRLLRQLRKCPNSREEKLRVHDYGYDWRLSPDLLSCRLISYLEKLECNHPDTPERHRGAFVIAHSLGGLLTRHAVNQRPDLFAGVVYAGVPQNCVNILGPLRNGDDVLLSSRVLTAQVNFTLRTSYALLPEDGRCFIDRNTGERIDLDFFDVKTWDEYRLSPCINPPLPAVLREQRKSLIGVFSDTISSSLPSAKRRSSWFGGSRDNSPSRAPESTKHTDTHDSEQSELRPDSAVKDSLEPTMGSSGSAHRSSLFGSSVSVSTACTIPREEAYEYLRRTLARTREFKRALAYKPEHEANNVYPPVSILFGRTVPTVYGARVNGREAIKHADAYDDLAFAAGDGVVLASAAQLPRGYRCVRGGRVETDRGHVGLLGDLEGVGQCLGAVWEARSLGVGLGAEYHYRKGMLSSDVRVG